MKFLKFRGELPNDEYRKGDKNYRKIGLKTNISNYGWYTCVHCGKKFRKDSIDIDHIIPQSKGGMNSPKNLQCLCIHCNRSKGNKTSQTSEDLMKRKKSYSEYQRSTVLKPRLDRERKKLNQLKHTLTDQDIDTLMTQAQEKGDMETYYDIAKEKRRREKRKL